MNYIKKTLMALLVLVGLAFGLTTLGDQISGREVPPEIQGGEEVLEISVTSGEEALLAGIRASDAQDGDLTDQIHIQGISKLMGDNTAKVTYIVFDRHGNFDTMTRLVRYTDYEKPVFQVTQPLIYGENEPIRLLDRIRVTDVLDGDLTDSVRVSSLTATSDPEVWTVAVQATNSMGDTIFLELPLIIHAGRMVRPDVELTDYLIYLDQGDTFRADRYLSRVTTPDGTGKRTDVVITGQVDTAQPGTYYVFYRYPYGVTTGLSVLTVVVR